MGAFSQVAAQHLDGFFIGKNPRPNVIKTKMADTVLRNCLTDRIGFDLLDVGLLNMPGGPIYLEWERMQKLSDEHTLAAEKAKRIIQSEVDENPHLFLISINFTVNDGTLSIFLELTGTTFISHNTVAELEQRVIQATSQPVSIHAWFRSEAVISASGYQSYEAASQQAYDKQDPQLKKDIQIILQRSRMQRSPIHERNQTAIPKPGQMGQSLSTVLFKPSTHPAAWRLFTQEAIRMNDMHAPRVKYSIYTWLVLVAISWLTVLPGPARAAEKTAPLATVSSVDLNRYLGKWYEIASYPAWFQKGCTGSTADYSLLPDGRLRVVNRCYKKSLDGPEKESVGKAEVVDTTTNAKLKVWFFWPFKGDYWIIDLDPDYQWAVVGVPSRKYLWILCRSPSMDATVYQGIIKRLIDNKYDPTLLQRTPQPN